MRCEVISSFFEKSENWTIINSGKAYMMLTLYDKAFNEYYNKAISEINCIHIMGRYKHGNNNYIWVSI